MLRKYWRIPDRIWPVVDLLLSYKTLCGGLRPPLSGVRAYNGHTQDVGIISSPSTVGFGLNEMASFTMPLGWLLTNRHSGVNSPEIA